MGKSKHQSAVNHLQKAIFIGVFLPILLLFILPNFFMAVAYFQIPDDTLALNVARLQTFVNREHEVFVITELGGGTVTVFPALRAKFIIDGQIVPFWNLEVILDIPNPLDPVFKEDIVCMKPNLAPGDHEIRVVRRNWTDIYSITLPFRVTASGSVIPN